MDRKRVLFVDDDQNVLDGLKRMLRPMRGLWEMHFALSGQEALKIMEKQPVDVIVSDMRMPGMDGARLLTRVRDMYPGTVRIVLSGHSDINVVVQAVLPAHQYLAKPCSPETIKAVISRALIIRNYIENDSVRFVISKISSLPAIPDIYHQVMEEMSKPEPSLKQAGEIISRDVGMSAKLLKLVNSSFFGFYRHISSPEQAATLLGIKVLKALIVSVQIFSQYDFASVPGFSMKWLWEHSLTTARLAEKIGAMEGLSVLETDDCYIGGLLHDLGKLILASQLPDSYNIILDKVRNENLFMHEAEYETLGASHAEVGAYLMGLWGMPHSVVEAVAFHHHPELSGSDFRPLSAVYIANILERKHYIINPDYRLPVFNIEHLEKMGLKDRMPVWDDMAEKEGRKLKAAGRGSEGE